MIIPLLVNVTYPISKSLNFRKENSLSNSVTNKFKIPYLLFFSPLDIYEHSSKTYPIVLLRIKEEGWHPKRVTKNEKNKQSKTDSVVTRRTLRKSSLKTNFICYPNS